MDLVSIDLKPIADLISGCSQEGFFSPVECNGKTSSRCSTDCFQKGWILCVVFFFFFHNMDFFRPLKI